MTALVEVAAFRPRSVPIEDLAERLALPPLEVRIMRRMYGLDRICWDPELSWAEQLLGAASGLSALDPSRIRYVFAARTINNAVPVSERPLHDVCAKLGVDNALAFTLTQHACASGLLGVDLAGKLLADDGDPDALALVFTGEKAFTRGTQLLPGVTIMGEAAAACLVSASGERDKLLGYATLIAGEYYDQVDDPDGDFARRYPEMLGDVLDEAVARAGLSWPEIALVLPHNVNRVSWVQIGKRLGVPLDRLYLDEVSKTGHCFAADSFVNQVSARAAGRLREGDAYVMAAAGLGSVCSAMVFRH